MKTLRYQIVAALAILLGIVPGSFAQEAASNNTSSRVVSNDTGGANEYDFIKKFIVSLSLLANSAGGDGSSRGSQISALPEAIDAKFIEVAPTQFKNGSSDVNAQSRLSRIETSSRVDFFNWFLSTDFDGDFFTYFMNRDSVKTRQLTGSGGDAAAAVVEEPAEFAMMKGFTAALNQAVFSKDSRLSGQQMNINNNNVQGTGGNSSFFQEILTQDQQEKSDQ